SGVEHGSFSGGRFTLGYWLDPCALCGVEGTVFFLGQRIATFNAEPGTFPGIARPFFDLNDNIQNRELTSTPGLLGPPAEPLKLLGSIHVDLPTRLWGAEANWRSNLWCGCLCRVDLLAGFRYLDLDEGVHITEDVTSLQAVPGTNV